MDILYMYAGPDMASQLLGRSSSSSSSSLLHEISTHSTIQKKETNAIGTGQKLIAYTRACP